MLVAFFGNGDERGAASSLAAESHAVRQTAASMGGGESLVVEAGSAGENRAAVQMGGAHDTAVAVLAAAAPPEPSQTGLCGSGSVSSPRVSGACPHEGFAFCWHWRCYPSFSCRRTSSRR